MAENQKDDGFIRFRCKACGQRLKVKKTWEGGEVMPCPRCGELVNVPLANLESIAKAADMAETGQPGRLNVDPELLRKRLGVEGQGGSGAGTAGVAPTLRREGWSPQAAFGRIQELDQLAAGLTQINNNLMGELQRIYRNSDLTPEQREEQVKRAARQQRADILKLVKARLLAAQQKVQALQGRRGLNPSEVDHMARLERALEAVRLYARHVLGLKV